MAESNSKEEDRISKLPDDVLNNILSCLPTKTAVATGRLSRHWRHLWKHLSVLNFCDNSYDFQGHSKRFRSFALLVNGVLGTFLHTPHTIQKFSLNCAHSFLNDKFRACSVDTWVRTAIGLHPEKLDLNLVSCCSDIQLFKLPLSLFTSTNLVSLSLRGTINLHMQSSTQVTLPSLRNLTIDVYYAEVASVNLLLFGCQNIEILYLKFTTQSLDKLCIPPSLKRLTISIKKLGRTSTKWLLAEPHDLHFQEFRNLVRLELILPWFRFNYLLNLLQECPMLQVLMIQKNKKSSPISGWHPKQIVPDCLVSHLTVIEFKGFRGSPDEVSFVEHVLQKGLVLKTLIISDISLNQSKKYGVLKRLSNVPRASETCQLTFD
ncbi:F-box/RNI/FBD-like domain protein [Medicago truncatula]|uniref:F-box/RNI/FBD-like domain protein n=1 Tax=Medicago truncatula TaxID=3880 RepID=G7LDZ6_MEDTR|nr:F-box/RNI/FBD-like domain protein [Medicago truncatula]